MRGSIRRRGKKSWEIRIPLGRSPEGKRQTYYETYVGKREDADTRLNELLIKHGYAPIQKPTKLTVAAYLDQWLTTALPGKVSERTERDYAWIVEQYLKEPLGYVFLTKLTAIEVQKVWAAMQARGLSPRTIQYTRSVLRRALGQAVRWQMLERNVASATDTPRLVRRASLAFGVAGAAPFVKAAKADPLAAMWLLALDSGMRPEEYYALTWSNVDLQAGVVRVQRVLCRRPKSKGGGWYFGEPKTRGSIRSIHLAEQTIAALKKHKGQQARQRLAAKGRWKDMDLVFTDTLGGPLHSSNLHKRQFKKLREAAKLPKGFRPYDLRHSCATILLEKGVHPKIVQERLGHASINMTLDTYSHVVPSMQTAASEAFSEVFKTRGGQLGGKPRNDIGKKTA